MRIEPFQRDFSVDDLIAKMGGSIMDSDTMDASSYGIPTKNLSVSYPSTISKMKPVSQSGIKKPNHNKEEGVVIFEYKNCSESRTISKMECGILNSV